MGAIFSTPPGLAMADPRQLFLALMLVPLLIAAGLAYIKTFYGLTAFFKTKFSIRPHFRPMIGGLLVGVVCFADPRLLTTGYGWVQETINDHLAVGLILWLAIAKIILTSITIGSGGSGGVFGPSMVIGGLLGGAFGTFCHQWIPTVQPAVFVLLGMAGFFSAVSKTPISAIIMVSEMTVGYALLLPLMLVSSFCYLLMPRDVSMYVKQVARRMDSPAHLGDFVIDLLERIPVSLALSRSGRTSGFIQFGDNESLKTIFQNISASVQTTFPLTSAHGTLTGLIRLDDLRSAFMEPTLQELVIAKDAATTQFQALLPTDTLKMALHKMSQSRCAELPVISDADSGRILGLLSRSEILQAYNAEMQRTAH
jgi:CIC family chloride channel protein